MRIPRRLPSYPMGDNEAFYFGTDNDVNMYWNGTYLCIDGLNAELRISFATAGRTTIYGGLLSTDDLYLMSNLVDAYPSIELRGNQSIILTTLSASGIQFSDSGIGTYLKIYYKI